MATVHVSKYSGNSSIFVLVVYNSISSLDLHFRSTESEEKSANEQPSEEKIDGAASMVSCCLS